MPYNNCITLLITVNAKIEILTKATVDPGSTVKLTFLRIGFLFKAKNQ